MMLELLQDSTVAGILPPSAPLGWAGTILVGTAAALGTAGIRALGGLVDRKAGNLDNQFRKAIGPGLPVVATVLSAVLPLAGNAIGITDLPPADVVASAPLAAISGIVLRELGRRLIVPLAGRLGGLQ